MTPEEAPKLRARDLVPVDVSLHHRDTLRACRNFLRDIVLRGEVNMEPERLYRGVCKALNEEPEEFVEKLAT